MLRLCPVSSRTSKMLNFLFLVAADEEYLAKILREKASLRQKRSAYILYRPLGDRLASPRKNGKEVKNQLK